MIFTTTNENNGQLYGTIRQGDAGYIVSDLQSFLKDKTEATLHIHTMGGSVFDGNLIYNVIKGSNTKVNIIIDGLAASMGSILMLSGAKVEMAENAFIMVHAPSGYVEGSAVEMEKAGKLLRSIEKNMMSKYMAKTGKSEKEVKAWLVGDNWFDAQEALEAGLIDGITGVQIEDIDFSAVTDMKVSAVMKDFDERFTLQPTKETHVPTMKNPPLPPSKNKQNKQSNMKLNAKSQTILGVSETATEEELNAAIERVSKENDTLKAQAESDRKARIKALIDPAVTDGRITAKEREEWEALAESNFALASSSLEKLPKKETLPVDGQPKATAVADERKDWTFTDWSRKDTKGLLKMKEENPDAYQALLEKSGIKL